MVSPAAGPWTVAETDFPASGPAHEQLRFLLNYAVLAPSGHNTQPWRFKITDGAVELYADRSRALPVVDPDDRALTISCGAALAHLIVALHHFGYTGEVEFSEDTPDLLARVGPGNPLESSERERSLFNAIPKRRSNRLPFQSTPVPQSLISELQDLAGDEGAWLHVIDQGSLREQVADLIAEGDRIQMADKNFRRELATWMRSSRERGGDGMPGYAFGYSKIMDSLLPIVRIMVKNLDLGNTQAVKDRRLAVDSPILAVLSTKGDRPSDWLSAGQALARVLLRARSEEVWASFLNQPIEVSRLRVKLAESLSREGFPQLLLRMGYGHEVPPTPRRPVSSVLIPNPFERVSN